MKFPPASCRVTTRQLRALVAQSPSGPTETSWVQTLAERPKKWQEMAGDFREKFHEYQILLFNTNIAYIYICNIYKSHTSSKMAVHDPAQSKLSNVLGKSCGLTTVDMNQDKMHAACSHSPWKTPTATLSPRQQMHWRRPNRNRIAPQSELGWSTPNSPTGVHCTQASYGVMTAKLWWMVRIPWYPWIVSIILHHSPSFPQFLTCTAGSTLPP